MYTEPVIENCKACGSQMEPNATSRYCPECINLTHFERALLVSLGQVAEQLESIDSRLNVACDSYAQSQAGF